MPNLYSYIDFRKFLYDFVAEKKFSNPRFSLRLMANKINISPGTLVRILNGKRNLTLNLLPHFVSFLKLRERAAEYFTLLVEFDQAKNLADKNSIYDKIITIRKERFTKVTDSQYPLFDKWYYSVIRELVEINQPVRDCRQLVPLMPRSITLRNIENGINALLSAGLIKQQADGSYIPGERFLTTGERWESFAIQRYQKEMMEQGIEALHNNSREDRDISTLTVGLTGNDMVHLREIIRKARQEILDLAEKTDTPEIVYQVNFQAFKLSLPKKGEVQ